MNIKSVIVAGNSAKLVQNYSQEFTGFSQLTLIKLIKEVMKGKTARCSFFDKRGNIFALLIKNRIAIYVVELIA